jgi:hypothetical protein
MLPLSCDPCNTEQSMNVSQNYNSSHRLPKRSSRPEACPMTDPFALQRFIDAQEPVYQRVLAKLRRGQKQSHWMWFIFP